MPRLRPPVPWIVVLQAAVAALEHWREIPEHDRRRLRELVAKSHGRPSNLTRRERAELQRIVRTLDLLGLGRRMLPLGRRGRRHRRR